MGVQAIASIPAPFTSLSLSSPSITIITITITTTATTTTFFVFIIFRENTDLSYAEAPTESSISLASSACAQHRAVKVPKLTIATDLKVDLLSQHAPPMGTFFNSNAAVSRWRASSLAFSLHNKGGQGLMLLGRSKTVHGERYRVSRSSNRVLCSSNLVACSRIDCACFLSFGQQNCGMVCVRCKAEITWARTLCAASRSR
eukprot:1159582-Rhodomonas_salina.2